jgi:GNAT superfamily N-acetyltransferase
MDELIERAIETSAALLELGNEVFEAEDATFVRNKDHPLIYDANHVSRIRARTEAEIERLFQRAEQEYSHCGHRRFTVDFRTPPQVAARLTLEGYERNDELALLLEGELTGETPPVEVRPLESEADWEAYAALKQMDWDEYTRRLKRPFEPEVRDSLIAIARRKQPPVQYFMAWLEGRPVAYMFGWSGTNGVGQVEDLFTHPEYRHRGAATALIHRCVAHAREGGTGPVVIFADPTDTPKKMYASLGFQAVAVNTHFLKKLERKPG